MRSGASVRVSLNSRYERACDDDDNDSDRVIERATKPTTTGLKKGDEIRISYVGYGETKLKGSREEIHSYLKKNYGFDCDCS